MTTQRIFTLVSLLATGACTRSTPATETKIIVGANDLTPVERDANNISPDYHEAVNAVGMMESGCTITHVGHNYAITAGHCMPEDMYPTNGVINNKPWNKEIYFGFREGQYTVLSHAKRIVRAQDSDGLDYALIELANAPDAAIDVLKTAPVKGDEVTIFSHPNGRALEWSRYCRIDTAYSAVPRITYRCDTEPGSSGAAVINVRTGRVVAIHNGGYNDQSSNYATAMSETPIPTLLAVLTAGDNGSEPDSEPPTTTIPGAYPSSDTVPLASWDNMANNADWGLWDFPKIKTKRSIKFTLKVDLDHGYDYIDVYQGTNIVSSVSGTKTVNFTLDLPVKLRYRSDKDVKSTRIDLFLNSYQ